VRRTRRVAACAGDTAVGKSTCIRELMGAGEERPYVQRSSEQLASTTYNVNLFPCGTLLPGLTINFLDFEGEGGSAMPVMGGAGGASSSSSSSGVRGGGSGGTVAAHAAAVAAARAAPWLSLGKENRLPTDMRSLTTAALTPAVPALPRLTDPASILTRSREVREHFPRLAYTASDVVCLIGIDKLFGARYLERALAFAKAANNNVQDVELPVLMVIANKVDVDECEMNIEKTTR
jgi:hypothetical protein